MSSTEDSVRTVIVSGLREIAQSKLDFDDVGGNIHDYLIEWENDEDRATYMSARAGGKTKFRAWGVQVLGADTIIAQGAITNRDYFITIAGYYGAGKNGEGINALISHARKVREKLKSYGVHLSNTLDTIRDGSPLNVEIFGTLEDGEKVLRGVFTYLGARQNPDW